MAMKRTLNNIKEVEPLHFNLRKGGGLEVFTALPVLNMGKIGREGVGWGGINTGEALHVLQQGN
jgi:hypothetical protein